MARALRLIRRGYCYHLINRGNNRARIFHDGTDYRAFLALMREAQQKIPLPLLAVCLMPSHIHLVVQPREDSDVSRWIHWLLTVHVKRYHKKYGTSGSLWGGRFKSFPIQRDRHLLVVMRYVERNALRAGLVDRAEGWRWGSLHWRSNRRLNGPPIDLACPPVALPDDWTAYVNQPQTDEELNAIRKSVNQERPFGDRDWVVREE